MKFLRIFWPIWTFTFLAFGIYLVLAHAPAWNIAATLGFTVPLSAFMTWKVHRDD